MDIKYMELKEASLTYDLFVPFHRHQEVKKCWRKEDNNWILKEIAFIEEWNKEEKEYLAECLKNTIKTDGKVCGSFYNGELIGFVSVEKEMFGSKKQYVELTSLHISEEYRGKGVGKQLFQMAQKYCLEFGASKLYISAHSSQETQAFYKAMGCVEAEEYNMAAVEKEPCDCQLECLAKFDGN
ncbi:acetyltransferase (GNAT) family protein [Mobilisporobacter senegalensis]|uniref:Acetyltransferase (GNAT) family protein n=1 Tax=Mobilisporobacter senegalensis TaxID=1329262 RepID=A0A3N1XKZ8_9FIRM|nr:GNAT family N-acetyltransferase [Mobilisporobacter senegalensis]ROR27383.1 acetyltransferase (GNAT) family protein [Mobilisporobacter senegalensis]